MAGGQWQKFNHMTTDRKRAVPYIKRAIHNGNTDVHIVRADN